MLNLISPTRETIVGRLGVGKGLSWRGLQALIPRLRLNCNITLLINIGVWGDFVEVWGVERSVQGEMSYMYS